MSTIIWAGLGLPDANASIVADFALCVESDRIVATGTRSELKQLYPNAELFGDENWLLMPALVNSHDHGRAIGSASLGIADDLLEIWLPKLATQLHIPPYLAAAYDAIQLLKSGVSVTAHSHNPVSWETLADECHDSIRGYRDAGIRVAFHPPMIDQNPLIYANQDRFLSSLPREMQSVAQQFMSLPDWSHQEYIELCDQLYRQYHDAQSHTIHIQVSPAGGQWCSDALIQNSVEWAKRRDTRVQMHLLETRYQAIYAKKQWGKSFIQHFNELQVLGDWLTLAHMVHVEESDFEILAHEQVGIAHNPSSNLRLRSGIAPIAKMINRGIRVGVGLDGHGLDDDQDYLRELRLAWTLGNQPGAATASLTAGQMWNLGTRSGVAITLGETVQLGALSPGYLADIVCIDWKAVCGAWAPNHYLSPDYRTEFLLRRASRQHVQCVMVNGQWVIRDGQCVSVSEDEIVTAIRDALAKQLAERTQGGMEEAVNQLVPHIRRFYAGWEL